MDIYNELDSAHNSKKKSFWYKLFHRPRWQITIALYTLGTLFVFCAGAPWLMMAGQMAFVFVFVALQDLVFTLRRDEDNKWWNLAIRTAASLCFMAALVLLRGGIVAPWLSAGVAGIAGFLAMIPTGFFQKYGSDSKVLNSN